MLAWFGLMKVALPVMFSKVAIWYVPYWCGMSYNQPYDQYDMETYTQILVCCFYLGKNFEVSARTTTNGKGLAWDMLWGVMNLCQYLVC